MKQWQIVVAVSVIALVSAAGGYQLQQSLLTKKPSEPVVAQKGPTPEELIGTQAEEFTLFDVDGEQRVSSEWQGKVIAINFWATWCPPCIEEIPHFVSLQDLYSPQGLQFVGIALQHADEIRDFLAEHKVNYPALVGGSDVMRLSKKLGNGIGALPYTVILDRKGNIAFTKRGALSKDEAESVIQALL